MTKKQIEIINQSVFYIDGKPVNTYNGWKNYETWNVALHIDNDYNLHKLKEIYSEQKRASYNGFVLFAGLDGMTEDGVSWTDETLDYTALNEFIRKG